MLIMMYAYARATGDGSFAGQHVSHSESHSTDGHPPGTNVFTLYSTGC